MTRAHQDGWPTPENDRGDEERTILVGRVHTKPTDLPTAAAAPTYPPPGEQIPVWRHLDSSVCLHPLVRHDGQHPQGTPIGCDCERQEQVHTSDGPPSMAGPATSPLFREAMRQFADGLPGVLGQFQQAGFLDEDHRMTPEEDVAGWWHDLAEADIKATLPKLAEYGASDLAIMGGALTRMLPPEVRAAMSDEDLRRVGVEMAIANYLLGKVGRMFSAWEQGREPSDDTIKDARIYSIMLTRAREHGGWPYDNR